MWILINWANYDGSDILPVNEKEESEETKCFTSKEQALKWAKKNLNFEYMAIEI